MPAVGLADDSLEEAESNIADLEEKLTQKKEELRELESEAGLESSLEDSQQFQPGQFSPPEIANDNFRGKIIAERTEEAEANSDFIEADPLALNKIDDSQLVQATEKRVVEIEIISQERKGEKLDIIDDLRGNPNRLDLAVGDKVVINAMKVGDQPETYTIKDFYHLDWLLVWMVIFGLAIVVIGRKKGLLALLSLILSIGVFVLVLFPLLSKGYSPVLLTLGCSVIIIFCVLLIITGKSKKTVVAAGGTIGGVVVASVLVFIIGELTRINGLGTETTRILTASFPGLDFKGIFYSGVIIGSLGAVMDIAVSIASSQREVVCHKTEISRKKLFKSGMNVGRDVMGSMVNTLIFAYFGSSLVVVLMFSQSDVALDEVINLGFVTEEIVRALVGSFGLLAAIPAAAFFGMFIYRPTGDYRGALKLCYNKKNNQQHKNGQ